MIQDILFTKWMLRLGLAIGVSTEKIMIHGGANILLMYHSILNIWLPHVINKCIKEVYF